MSRAMLESFLPIRRAVRPTQRHFDIMRETYRKLVENYGKAGVIFWECLDLIHSPEDFKKCLTDRFSSLIANPESPIDVLHAELLLRELDKVQEEIIKPAVEKALERETKERLKWEDEARRREEARKKIEEIVGKWYG